MLTGAGLDAASATALITTLIFPFALANGLGRPIFGTLTDKLTPRNTALVTYVLILIACLLIYTNYTSQFAYTLGFILLWGCLGGWLAIAPASTGCYFGTRDYPRCYGVVFLAYGAGAIAGPQLAGFIKTSTGSYLGVFPYVLILAIIGLVIAFAMMKQPASPEKA